MSKIDSSNVKVFPSALREGSYASGKFTSELNMSNILKSITDVNSYIIDATYANGSLTAKFVINGYYFEIEGLSASGSLYAHIRVNVDDQLAPVTSDDTSSLDDGGKFIGLEFDNNASLSSTLPGTIYTLQLLNNSAICEDKKVKFNSDSISVNGDVLSEFFSNGQVANAGTADKMSLGSVGSPINGVYVSSDGTITPMSGNVGGLSVVDETTFKYVTVKLVNGELVPGQTLYFSTVAPLTTVGNKGDIWYIYKE